MFLDPMFREEDDLNEQTTGYLKCRVVFGIVANDKNSPGWSALGDFKVNVTVQGTTHKYVPIPNPNPSSGGTRSRAAIVGDTVMLLQFIDGTLICLGRVKV